MMKKMNNVSLLLNVVWISHLFSAGVMTFVAYQQPQKLKAFSLNIFIGDRTAYLFLLFSFFSLFLAYWLPNWSMRKLRIQGPKGLYRGLRGITLPSAKRSFLQIVITRYSLALSVCVLGLAYSLASKVNAMPLFASLSIAGLLLAKPKKERLEVQYEQLRKAFSATP